jgi:hypothetical protein
MQEQVMTPEKHDQLEAAAGSPGDETTDPHPDTEADLQFFREMAERDDDAATEDSDLGPAETSDDEVVRLSLGFDAQQIADELNKVRHKSVTAVLELAATYDACHRFYGKDKMAEVEALARYPSYWSSYLPRIFEERERFTRPNASSTIPGSISKMYLLANVPMREFNAALDAGKITPKIRREDVKALHEKPNEAKASDVIRKLIAEDPFSVEQEAELDKELAPICEKFHLRLEVPKNRLLAVTPPDSGVDP